MSTKKNLKTLTFPSLASLTLAACGGGGGGGSMVQPAPTNRAPVAAADKTVSMDEDATSQALDISTPTDADGNSLTITVTAVPTGGTVTTADGTEVTVNSTLTISQLTGLLFTPDANLNDDNTDFGTFTYTVSDGSLTDTGKVTISVTPIQDAPELVGVMEFAIDENTTTVADITATDVDDDTLTYSITGGDDQTLFDIDASTGALSFINRPDYENPADSDQDNIYSVQVNVSDGNGGSASQTYIITVNDVITHVAITNTAVDENDDGAIVGTLSAAIDDINATHEYTYTLSGDDADAFEVVDGQLKLKDGVSANYEAQNSYTVTVTATDSGGLSTSEDFTITINDVNDAPSDIEISRVGLMDNTDGAEVGTLTTTDEDTTDSHTYTVSDDRFEVTSTGLLKLKAGQSIDNVAEPTVTLTITSTDKGGISIQEEYTLTVGTVQISATTFEENAEGVVIGTLSVIDPDFTANITYTLSGNGSENFEVIDGQLKLKDGIAANYEVLNSYSLTITATDDSSYTKSTTYPFDVTDVNEAPTAIALSGTTINENIAGAVIGDLTTTDEDTGDSHTYTLSGNDADSFEVVDGQLKLKDGVSANYEAQNSYTVTVTATDSGGLSTSEDFTITINDVNDAPSGMKLTGSLYVNENDTGGVVGDITTVDEDTGDSHTYAITGMDADAFEIVNDQLKLKDEINPVHQTQGSYSITVTSTDQGGITISEDYSVEVNIAPTEFSLDNDSVDENYVGAPVGWIAITDANIYDEFTYELDGVGAEKFEVVSGGQLIVKSGTWLDYETGSTSYTLTITITDQGGYSLEKTLTIDVNDVDYGNPWFSEHVSVFDMPISDDIEIQGQQWVSYWEDDEEWYQDFSLRFAHDDDPSTPLVITYSLINTDSVLGDNYDDGYEQGEDGVYSNIENYSEDWEATVDKAFEYWGNVSGITFVKVEDNESMCGDIRIALSSGEFYGGAAWSNVPYYFQGENNSSANDIWVRADYDQWGEDWPGYNLLVLLHEIGHSLGLSHTHHDHYSAVEQNTNLYSVMSYIGVGYLVNAWPGYEVDYWLVQDQPAINDIKTIQYLYGMTPEYNQGNTTYTYTGPVYTTIYDTGGIDTIVLSSFDLDISLDLRGGTISYIGTEELEMEIPYGNGDGDYYYGYTGFPIGIEENTVIEHAITGSGNDTITCNVAENIITCGAGDDDIFDVGSGDTIRGERGYDSFWINSLDFTLIDGGSGTDVMDGEGDMLVFDDFTGSSIDLRAFTDAQLTGIEDIDIEDGRATTLKISYQALVDLECTYLRDMDGDLDLDIVVYIHADALLDEIQINDEGWTLETPIDSGDNVFDGYSYYSSADGEVWFAYTTGTSVILNPDGDQSAFTGIQRIMNTIEEPITATADDDISVTLPDGDWCPAGDDQAQPGIAKGDDFGCRSRGDELPNLLVEAADPFDLMLPETVADPGDLPEPDLSLLAGLISDDTESLVMTFDQMTEDNVISASIESIGPIESDPISQTDLIIDTDWNPIQEELLYISELG